MSRAGAHEDWPRPVMFSLFWAEGSSQMRPQLDWDTDMIEIPLDALMRSNTAAQQFQGD